MSLAHRTGAKALYLEHGRDICAQPNKRSLSGGAVSVPLGWRQTEVIQEIVIDALEAQMRGKAGGSVNG